MKVKCENDEMVIKDGTLDDKGISIEFKHHVIEIDGVLSMSITGKLLEKKHWILG